MADIIAWHGRTLSQHEALRDEWAAKGYRFLSLSIYGPVAAPVYATVMIKRANIVAQRQLHPEATLSAFLSHPRTAPSKAAVAAIV